MINSGDKLARNFILNTAFCLLGMLLVFGCSGPKQDGKAGAESVFTGIQVLVTGNSNGMIQPCDCELGPLGGLAKRKTLFDSLSVGSHTIRLELGGIVDPLTPATSYPAIVAALDSLCYDLVLPGEGDKGLWAEARLQKQKQWQGQTGPVYLTHGDYVVQVAAFSDAWGYSELSPKQQNSMKAGNVDLSLWITHVPDDSLMPLLQRLPHPDLILAGGSQMTSPQPDTLLGVPVQRPGIDGMDLLELKISFSGGEPEIRCNVHWVDETIQEDETIHNILAGVARR